MYPPYFSYALVLAASGDKNVALRRGLLAEGFPSLMIRKLLKSSRRAQTHSNTIHRNASHLPGDIMVGFFG